MNKHQDRKNVRNVFMGIFMVLFLNVNGQTITVETAKTVGQTFLNSKGNKSELKLVHSTSEYYVFNGETGFVIVSNSNNVVPILGYSTSGTFDITNIPPSLTEILNGYSREISYVISEKLEVSTYSKEWENLSNGIIPKVQKSGSVEPMIKTQWGQGDQTQYKWYNDSCPYDETAKRNVLVGCGAVTMAQIMKYYEWPKQGSSSRTYNANYNGNNYGPQSANFGETTYNWELMPNKLTGANSAVAQLMYHCGVSVNMQYGANYSGSYGFINPVSVDEIDNVGNPNIDIVTSLQRYFKYSEGIYQIEKRNFNSDEEWISLIKEELNEKRPINYGSSTHSYICDGYDENNLLHMNFGWTGSCNGYFSVASIIPTQGTWSQNHTNGQYAIMGIKPNKSTGISEVNTTSVRVYPNPTTDKVFVETESNIKVFSSIGQLLQEVFGTEVSLKNYTSGIYFIQVNGITTKIVKQ